MPIAAKRRRPGCCRGYLLMEAMVSIAILALMMTMAYDVLNGVAEHRMMNRAMLVMQAELTARAENLRATGYDELSKREAETVEVLEAESMPCRLTIRTGEVDRARPGLLRIILSGELLDDEGRTLRRREIEVMKARRQWAQ